MAERDQRREAGTRMSAGGRVIGGTVQLDRVSFPQVEGRVEPRWLLILAGCLDANFERDQLWCVSVIRLAGIDCQEIQPICVAVDPCVFAPNACRFTMPNANINVKAIYRICPCPLHDIALLGDVVAFKWHEPKVIWLHYPYLANTLGHSVEVLKGHAAGPLSRIACDTGAPDMSPQLAVFSVFLLCVGEGQPSDEQASSGDDNCYEGKEQLEKPLCQIACYRGHQFHRAEHNVVTVRLKVNRRVGRRQRGRRSDFRLLTSGFCARRATP